MIDSMSPRSHRTKRPMGYRAVAVLMVGLLRASKPDYRLDAVM